MEFGVVFACKNHIESIYRYTIYIDLMPSHMSSTQAKDTNTFYWWFVFVFVCGVWLEIISSLYEHCHLACNELDTQALFMGIVHWAFKACLQVMLHCLQIPYTSMSQYGDNTDGVCARDARVYSLWAMNVNWFDMEKEMESVPTSVAVAANQNNAWIYAYFSCWSSQITRLRRTIMAELIFRVSLCCIFFLNFLARKLNEMRWQTDSYEKQNWVINEN